MVSEAKTKRKRRMKSETWLYILELPIKQSRILRTGIGCAKVEVVESIVPTKGQNRKDNLPFFGIDLFLIGRTK